MAEYLEKSAVIKAIHDEIYDGGKWSGGWYERPEEQAEKSFTKRINAITPVTREHGEWINVENGIEYDWATCSICGGRTMMARRYYPFCPHCGADMRGKKE